MSTTYGPGKHRALVIGQRFEKAKTGTVGFVIDVKILGRLDEQGNLQVCPSFERSCRNYFKSEAGVALLKNVLESLGVNVTGLAQLDPDSPDAVSLVGRTIDVTCEHELYNGETVERWQLPRIPARNKLDLSDVRALSAQYDHLFRGNAQPKPAAPPAKPNDSDVPF